MSYRDGLAGFYVVRKRREDNTNKQEKKRMLTIHQVQVCAVLAKALLAAARTASLFMIVQVELSDQGMRGRGG